jgi:UDP-glucose-4-epimerase GalE
MRQDKRSEKRHEKIVVVGGAGYVGAHMVTLLQDEGYEVMVLDNLSRGVPNATSAPLFEIDLRDVNALDTFFSKYPCDLVMHFAALAYVGESVVEPALYYQNNVVGTLNLLDVIRKYGKPPLVFSSSCATYGEPNAIPISESHLQNPINPYGKSKFFIEQALRDYGNAYGQQSISLRYFNAAGCDPQGRVGEEHQPETHLIPLVLAEALRLKKGGNSAKTTLQVFGHDFATADGSCVRDYIHVSDLCLGHLQSAKRLFSGAVKGAEFYNLANGYGFSVLEVINACRQVTGQDIGFTIQPRRTGDPAVLIGDASQALKILAWSPQIPALEDIIASAWNWVVQHDRQLELVAQGK